MATVSLPGGPTLSYREWGRPDGAVVLMLHGLGSSGASWRHVAPALGRRFRVIAPDARGHGIRDHPSHRMADQDGTEHPDLLTEPGDIVGHQLR